MDMLWLSEMIILFMVTIHPFTNSIYFIVPNIMTKQKGKWYQGIRAVN